VVLQEGEPEPLRHRAHDPWFRPQRPTRRAPDPRPPPGDAHGDRSLLSAARVWSAGARRRLWRAPMPTPSSGRLPRRLAARRPSGPVGSDSCPTGGDAAGPDRPCGKDARAGELRSTSFSDDYGGRVV